MKEKRDRLRREKENEDNYAQYVSEVTRVRGQMEQRFLQKKKQNQVEMMEFNQKMSKRQQIERENEKRDHFLEEREYLRKQQEIRRDTEYKPAN